MTSFTAHVLPVMATDLRVSQIKEEKTGTHTNATDETDLAPNRHTPWNYLQAELRRIHIIWDIFAVGSILTFVADLTSDLVVSALYYQDESYLWFGLTLGFVLLSSFVMQCVSFKWYVQDNKNQNWITYLLHLCHLGPVVRYFRMIQSGCQTRQPDASSSDYAHYLAQWRDISMLRLFEAFFESAPQLVLQLYIMAYHRRFNIENDLFTVIAASCSLVSLAWAIVAYTKALRDSFQNQASLSWVGFVLQILWRIFMVTSRVVSLVLFAAEYRNWLFVALTVHWVVMTTWLVLQETKFCMDQEENRHHFYEVLFDGLIGFVYIFSFFNMKEGITRIRLISYYSIMLVENTVFVVMWYPARHHYGNIHYPALILVWGGFLLGAFCMVCYYNFYHPGLAAKGICLRKKQNDHSMITWCCCCEVHTGQDMPTTVHQRRHNRFMPRQSPGQLPYTIYRDPDLEIMPRSPSYEHCRPMAETPTNGVFHETTGIDDTTLHREETGTVPRPGTWV